MYKRKAVYKRNRNPGDKLNLVLGSLLVGVVVPVFMMTLSGKLKIEDLLNRPTKNVISKVESELPLIVAKQISIHMPEEVIKAQSVIARTQILSAEEKGKSAPNGFSVTDLQELWGEHFDAYYEKLQNLVSQTEGKVLRFEGDYIYAAYHQTSAGNTRNIREYYEKSGMPYLSSISCHEDTTAPDYLTVFFWTGEAFRELSNHVFAGDGVTGGADIQVLKRDAAGYALEVQVGQTIYEGEVFREKLNLPSAHFELTLIDEDVRIVTMGQGHGFGLSQHMAGVLAEEGKNYQEILQYFYKGVSVIE